MCAGEYSLHSALYTNYNDVHAGLHRLSASKGLHSSQRAQQHDSRALRRLQPDHARARARRATDAPRAQQIRHPHARRAAQRHLLCEVVGGVCVEAQRSMASSQK